MDEIDSYHTQHTPPPSPYHEAPWELKLDQVQEGLLHPKEKKLGYLELYFTGFMEFVDDVPPSPEISDDETEYPRWGNVSSKHKGASMSSATSEGSHYSDRSITGDFEKPLMCSTPESLGNVAAID
jgi:hypothetical protein